MKKTTRDRMERTNVYHTVRKEMKRHALGAKRMRALMSRMTPEEREQFFNGRSQLPEIIRSAPEATMASDTPTIKL